MANPSSSGSKMDVNSASSGAVGVMPNALDDRFNHQNISILYFVRD
jgi:hypothetical protein